jgi:hypothetical protein
MNGVYCVFLDVGRCELHFLSISFRIRQSTRKSLQACMIKNYNSGNKSFFIVCAPNPASVISGVVSATLS